MKKTNGITENNSGSRKHRRRASIAVLMLLALVVAQFGSSGMTASVLAADEEEAVEAEDAADDGTLTVKIDDDAIAEAAETEDETQAVAAEASAAAEETEAEDAEAEDEEAPAQVDVVTYEKAKDDITVTVEAPEGALPEGAELNVERFAEDSDEYKEAAKAIDYEEADGGMAALDISFTVDGREVEPDEAVKVSIDVSKILPGDADASSIEVQHIEENLFGLFKNAKVVANESSETEGTIDEANATAEFEVESFSAFTVTWTIANGPAAGTTYSVSVTAYLDGTELDDISGLTFNSENDELDFETLLSDVEYGTGDYTFSYAIASVGDVTYGTEENPLISIEISSGGNSSNFLLIYSDGTYVEIATSSTVNISAYYLTPDFSVSIEAVDEDETTEAWALLAVLSHAGSYQSISYEWTVTDSDGSASQYAKVTNTDNTGRAYIAWESETPDNTEVTVSVTVTLTLEDESTKTATADYVLEYGDETVDLIMTYGPNQTALPAGVTVTLTSESGNHVYTGTTDSDGWVHDLDIEPGIYIVTATYTDADGNTYSCSEEVAMHDAGNYSINLHYYNEEILTSVPTRSNWEHIDIKLSVGTTSNSDSGSVSVNITGAQIFGSDGSLKYTATEDTIEGNDNEFQLSFHEGDGSTGTAEHSIEFDTTDTISITYVLTIDGVEQSPVTIDITSATVYDDGTTYPVTGQRAYKLYNYLYGTSFSSDAQLVAAGLGDIDISGMSMMLVAAILCDSSEVTGAGLVQAVDGQAANQWGMDFALSIEAMNELAASWAFNIEKTYENASMTAGDFVFYLYNATVENDTWSLGDLQSTLTNQTAGMDLNGNSHDTMELFSIAYSDEAISAGETYYYILYEQPNTVTSGSGATITFDGTIFGVIVQLGTDADGEATVTATYYRMEQSGETYTIAETYTTGTDVDGKITFDEDDYATFEFTNNYQLYTEISGEKTWEDNENANETRPDSITINLLVDGEQAYDSEGNPISVTVTENDDWKWSFKDLPVYNGTTTFVYTIEEEVVSGYIPTYSDDGYSVTNSIPELQKYVSDPAYNESTDDNLSEDEADNNDTLKYKLEADHIGGAHDLVLHDLLDDQLDLSTMEIQSVILYKDADDTTGTSLTEGTDYTVTDRTCNDDECGMGGCSFEIHILYDVEDLSADAYVVVIFDIKVVEDIEDFDVNEYWNEIDNDLNLSYTVDGTATWTTPVEVETFSYGFDLYKYDEDTNEPLEGVEFVLSKDGDEGTVYAVFEASGNTYLLSEWVDSKDDATAIVTGSDGKAVIEGLHDGEFYLEETKALDGYEKIVGNITVTINVDSSDPFSPTIEATNATVDGLEAQIANTEGEGITIVGSKTWDDGNDADGIRPDSITISLYDDPDGDPIATQTVTADNNWAWSFKDLPEYDDDGNEINYIITEAEIDGYIYSVDGFDVTNTHEYETRDISGSKTWEDDDDKADARPTSVTVNLYQNGELYDSQTVTEDDDWTWSWADLPKNAGGEAIAYTITEDDVEYYAATYYSGSFDITNTFEGEEEGPDEGGDVPKTGDNNNFLIWALVMLLACLSVGEVYLVKRRRK